MKAGSESRREWGRHHRATLSTHTAGHSAQHRAHLGIDAGPPVDVVAAVHCPRIPADAIPDDPILLMDVELTKCTVELMPDGGW